jgi:putative endonuclease
MFYTYVLQSEIDMKFYVGFTKDLKQRFGKHQKGLVDSTKDRRPLKPVYYEACLNQSDATKREKYFQLIDFLGKYDIYYIYRLCKGPLTCPRKLPRYLT